MTTVTQIAEKLQTILGPVADHLGRETGFIKRQRVLKGSTFAQTLVFGWLGKPEASLSDLSLAAANVNVEVTRQGLDARFTEEAAHFMQAVLQAGLQATVEGPPVQSEVLQRFAGVYLLDSTSIGLPQALQTVWLGCGGSQGPSGCLKISVLWDMVCGGLQDVELLAGKTHDQCARAAQTPLPPGALRVADRGYFKLAELARMTAEHTYWLTRYKTNTAVFIQGERVDVPTYLETHAPNGLDCAVELGVRRRVPARLIAYPVAPEVLARRQAELAAWEHKHQCRASALSWTLLAWYMCLTNVPDTLLHAAQAVTLIRYRWQIELLFKLWKSEGLVDEWRTQHPWRILCEIYAKLLALVCQHWLLLLGLWALPSRSLTRATTTIRQFAWQIGRDLTDLPALCATFRHILMCLRGCRMEKSKAFPRAFQHLEALP
jgi:hypothetical protein